MFPRTQIEDGEESMRQLDDGPPPWVGPALAFIAALAFGFALGATMGECKFQAEAIKRGYAEYNATTGKWQWKGDKTEATE